MKQQQLDRLKAEAVAAAEDQHPGMARYQPCLTDGQMKVYVYDHDGHGQLHDVGVMV